jgi:hypothetical protein
MPPAVPDGHAFFGDNVSGVRNIDQYIELATLHVDRTGARVGDAGLALEVAAVREIDRAGIEQNAHVRR